MPRFDLIVIGSSAGSVGPLRSIVKSLPADLAAAVVLVMHIGESSSMPSVLNKCGTLPCRFVADSPHLERGHLYVAPPNYHIRIVDGKLALNQGPKENLSRPSIDPLFRSAARLYRNRVIGVILSGALDDGSAGLFAIANRGGTTIVQDPSEAEMPSMPQHAIRHTTVDYRLPEAKIGPTLLKLVGHQKKGASRFIEADKEDADSKSGGPHGGRPFPVSCPECQGPLFALKQGRDEYFHCRVGHAYSSASLHEAHDEALERSLWMSIRTLSERIILQRTMIQGSKKKDPSLARRLRDSINQTKREIGLLKEILATF